MSNIKSSNHHGACVIVVVAVVTTTIGAPTLADCVYEGRSYSRGAAVCVPGATSILTCSDVSTGEWVRADNDVQCVPNGCVNNGELFSEGGVYTRKDTTIWCEGGKWVPN